MYSIKIKKGSVSSDNVTYHDGTLTITKAPLTVKADNKTMYPGNEVPPLTISYSGWKLEETESVLTKKPIAKTVATSQSTQGTYPITVSGGEAQNYEFVYESGTLTIIQPTTYTFTIKSSGNGTTTYNGTTIRGKSSSFTVNEGATAMVGFSPDTDYQIKSVKVNNTDVTTHISDNRYIINNITTDISLEVEFEAIPPMTYSFTIKASGYGTATYNGTTIRSKSSSFTVNEGDLAVVSFTPDEGYRIKSVKVNNTDVTAHISNNRYSISNITADTFLDVEFEVITYTLTINSTGNGSAIFNNMMVRDKTTTFTISHGSSATITFAPDDGYRIKSIKHNNTDVTANVNNNQYTISSITADTSLEVEFEVITYSLTIKATGYGTAMFNNTTIRGRTTLFIVNHGTPVTVSFTPDNGFRIKSVKVNNTDVTARVSNNSYSISNLTTDTTLEVEFEEIPTTSYTLTIKADGNGEVTFNNLSIRNKGSPA